LKLLVLGGTQFLGRAFVEAAVERGHELTLFNRGETNPELFPEVEKLRGDRAVDPVPSGSWDAVVDTSGYLPAVVRASAAALREQVGRYLFVSSISAYADFSAGPREDSPRAELGDMPSDELLPGYENYGPLKALCEDVVTEVYGDRALIVRPGLIVGPHDPTGRFVDARDLGSWIVDLCEDGASGAFNGTAPGASWRELVDSCLRVTGSGARPVWIDGEWLAEQGVGQWMELPLWLHDRELVGMMRADVARALAAGLTFRPLDEIVRGTLELAETTDDAGIEAERERGLIEAWRAR
jgi:2'-hydroxyisoflavone reductase